MVGWWGGCGVVGCCMVNGGWWMVQQEGPHLVPCERVDLDEREGDTGRVGQRIPRLEDEVVVKALPFVE